MIALARARTLVLFTVTFVAGCASGPSLARAVEVEAGEATRVLLTQVQGRTTFLLQNASSADHAAFYSDPKDPVLGKVVPDAQLQALLDVFSEKGLFATGLGSVPPDARDVLVVENGGRRWTWARRQPGMQATEATFHEAKAYFLEVYNSSMAYRASDPHNPPDLTAEQARVRDDAEAAKGKLERLRGRQR